MDNDLVQQFPGQEPASATRQQDRMDLALQSLALSKALSLCVLVLPLLAAVGWVLQIPVLTQVVPAQPAMQPNTAFGLACGAVAILLNREANPGRTRTVVIWLLACLVLLLGLMTSLEYLLGRSFGIDLLLLPHPLLASQPYPGRPSPQSAFNFVLLGIAILAYRMPRIPAAISQTCALLMGANALVAGTGHLFGAAQFYGFPLYIAAIGMAIHTALTFMLLALAHLCGRPGVGIMLFLTGVTRSASMARRMLLASIVMPAIAGAMTRLGVLLGWYSITVQITLFSIAVVFLILGITWKSARRSEREELQARGAFEALQHTNQQLSRLSDERLMFSALIENSSDFIGIADGAGKPLYLNPAGRRMVGLSADYPVGNTEISDYYSPDQREFAAKIIVPAMVEHGHWEGETYFRHWQTQQAIPVSDTHFMIRKPGSAAILGMATITRDISELQRTRDTLRERELRLEQAQRIARLGSWELNIKTNELVWSDEIYRILEVDRAHCNPSYFALRQSIHPADRAVLDAAQSASLRTRAPYSVDYRLLLDDGRIKHVHEECETSYDAETPVRSLGILQDITERKLLEEKLRFAEARASGMIAISADAIISVDRNQRIVLFNEGAEKIFGYTKDDVMGLSLDILLPSRFRPAHHRYVEQFVRGRDAARKMGKGGSEIFGLRKDGREFPADAAISKLEIDGSTLLTVAIRDVTVQKSAEREQRLLADVGALLAATLDYDETLTAIAQFSVREFADFCIVDVFSAVGERRRIVVASRDPSLEWACDVFRKVPIDRDKPHPIWSVADARASLLLERLSLETVSSFAQTDLHLKTLRAVDPKSAIVTPLMTHERVLGTLAFVSTTPERQYGQSDLHLAEALALRAAFAIENARLYCAAQRAISARDDMVAIIAHDLRNPLMSITVHAEVLRGFSGQLGRRDPLEDVTAIKQSAERMSHMIRDLLDVSRIEAGRMTLELGRVQTRQLLQESLQSQGLLVSKGGLELRSELAAELPDVWGDRHRLLQALENLIGNAIKFTTAGGHITVGAKPHEEAVLFWVGDTGAGIATDQLTHIFDRYWQGRSRDQRGAGLGLAIVKGVVESHGGQIRVESMEGRGTTVFFTIATAPVPQHKTASEPSQDQGAPTVR
jgi:PAS domain S-box-containing protein